MESKVYSVVSRWGLSAQPDDQEWVRANARCHARHGQGEHFCHPILDDVLYWESRTDAERHAATLKPHRPGARIYVTPHDADADYIVDRSVFIMAPIHS